jgi:hypothetical protein
VAERTARVAAGAIATAIGIDKRGL